MAYGDDYALVVSCLHCDAEVFGDDAFRSWNRRVGEGAGKSRGLFYRFIIKPIKMLFKILFLLMFIYLLVASADDCKPRGWSRTNKEDYFNDVPTMTTAVAKALRDVERLAGKHLPKESRRILDPLFAQARAVLGKSADCRVDYRTAQHSRSDEVLVLAAFDLAA